VATSEKFLSSTSHSWGGLPFPECIRTQWNYDKAAVTPKTYSNSLDV